MQLAASLRCWRVLLWPLLLLVLLLLLLLLVLLLMLLPVLLMLRLHILVHAPLGELRSGCHAADRVVREIHVLLTGSCEVTC